MMNSQIRNRIAIGATAILIAAIFLRGDLFDGINLVIFAPIVFLIGKKFQWRQSAILLGVAVYSCLLISLDRVIDYPARYGFPEFLLDLVPGFLIFSIAVIIVALSVPLMAKRQTVDLFLFFVSLAVLFLPLISLPGVFLRQWAGNHLIGKTVVPRYGEPCESVFYSKVNPRSAYALCEEYKYVLFFEGSKGVFKYSFPPRMIHLAKGGSMNDQIPRFPLWMKKMFFF